MLDGYASETLGTTRDYILIKVKTLRSTEEQGKRSYITCSEGQRNRSKSDVHKVRRLCRESWRSRCTSSKQKTKQFQKGCGSSYVICSCRWKQSGIC